MAKNKLIDSFVAKFKENLKEGLEAVCVVQFTCDFCYLVNFETMLFCMTCSLEKSIKNQDFLGGRKLFVT